MTEHTCNSKVARGFAGMLPPILPCAACEAEFIAKGGFVPPAASLTGTSEDATSSSAEVGIQLADLAPASAPLGGSELSAQLETDPLLEAVDAVLSSVEEGGGERWLVSADAVRALEAALEEKHARENAAGELPMSQCERLEQAFRQGYHAGYGQGADLSAVYEEAEAVEAWRAAKDGAR